MNQRVARRPGHSYGRGLSVAAAIVVLASLAGCSGAGISEPLIDFPSASEIASAAPDEPIAGDLDGNGRISNFEKQVIDSHAARDFTMPDGSVVSINPDEPLPAPVVQVVASQGAPIVQSLDNSTVNSYDEGMTALSEFADTKAAELGKPVVLVYQTDSVQGLVWASVPSGVRSTGVQAQKSREDMIASVQGWGSNRGYEVIVIG